MKHVWPLLNYPALSRPSTMLACAAFEPSLDPQTLAILSSHHANPITDILSLLTDCPIHLSTFSTPIHSQSSINASAQQPSPLEFYSRNSLLAPSSSSASIRLLLRHLPDTIPIAIPSSHLTSLTLSSAIPPHLSSLTDFGFRPLQPFEPFLPGLSCVHHNFPLSLTARHSSRASGRCT